MRTTLLAALVLVAVAAVSAKYYGTAEGTYMYVRLQCSCNDGSYIYECMTVMVAA